MRIVNESQVPTSRIRQVLRLVPDLPAKLPLYLSDDRVGTHGLFDGNAGTVALHVWAGPVREQYPCESFTSPWIKLHSHEEEWVWVLGHEIGHWRQWARGALDDRGDPGRRLMLEQEADVIGGTLLWEWLGRRAAYRSRSTTRRMPRERASPRATVEAETPRISAV